MKIVVLGGGVGGMTCGLELRARGHEVTVLEREARPGGKVGTEQHGEWRIETGPVGVLDNAPDTKALIGQLGLEAEVVPASDAAKHRFMLLGGKLRALPDSPPKILTSGALKLSEKWRIFREPKAPPAPSGVDESMAEFARRRFGASLAERFVEPVASGVFAGDYARLSLRSAFPKIAELEREHGSLIRGLMAMEKARKAEGRPRELARLTSFKGGMGALPAALARALGDSLKPGVVADAITKWGQGWVVQTPGGPVECERLVLALPPDEAARLMQPIDAAMADAYAAIPVNSITAVSLGYPRARVTRPLDGFGFLVPRMEGQRLLGVLWMTSFFPEAAQAPRDHVLLRCLIGGTHDPGAAQLADEALVTSARDGLRATMGIDGEPEFTHVVRWKRGIAQYVVGHAGRVATIEERGLAIGISSTGAALHGVGVNDVIRDAKALAQRIPA
jgi:oxygen-dependent protoporphyrinogen oxidase